MSRKLPPAVGIHRLPRPHPLRRLRLFAVVAALVGTTAAGYGYQLDRAAFFQGYLVAYLFLLGLALGPIGLLGLQYVAGGRWGVVIRRPLEAAARTLPVLAVLFVPVILGMHELYEWTHVDVVAHDDILQKKAVYLNETFFLARAAIYFSVWGATAFLLCRFSRQQDESPSESIDRKLEFAGRGALILYALTMTFAAVDWAMSIDPHWFSHIYGLRMIGGQVLTAFAFSVAITVLLARRGPIGEFVAPARLHDLGNLMLAFVMLWAYFELSQFLIIWSGNLPEETPFYIRRLATGWKFYAGVLVAFHFVAPFVVLLSRPVKRNPTTLAAVAVGLLVMRVADLYWQIIPSFREDWLAPHWLLPAILAGMGGLWFCLYVWQLEAHPLLPASDRTLLDPDYE